jgi:hypothetical protein
MVIGVRPQTVGADGSPASMRRSRREGASAATTIQTILNSA